MTFTDEQKRHAQNIADKWFKLRMLEAIIGQEATVNQHIAEYLSIKASMEYLVATHDQAPPIPDYIAELNSEAFHA